MDAFRGAVTLLVVLHHTAIVYGAQGGWYYHEVAPSGRLSSLLLSFFCALNQAWFMGAFFMLAGYFTPPALARKGAAAFARDRLVRLGLPIVGYALLLHPLTVAIAQTTKGAAPVDTFLRIWGDAAFGMGPLWFAFALLVFTGLWMAFGRALSPLRELPSNRTLMIAALLTGAAAFLLRLEWPVGVAVLSLQLGYFPGYVVLFVFGCLGSAARLLENVPPAQARLWRRIAWLCAPILPIAALLQEKAGVALGVFEGGWSIAAMLYAFWEPLVAWGIILGLLIFFQRRFAVLDGLWPQLVRRAFAIYVIHPPILTGLAVAWSGVQAPPLLKFGVTGALSCLACYLLAGLVLRIPGLNRIL